MKIIKWLLFIILGIIILFFITLLGSRLFLYNENNFNIVETFFNTKYYDKEFNSEENGFLELIKFLNFLEKKEDILNNYDGIAKGYNIPDIEKEIKERKSLLFNNIGINKYKSILGYYKKIQIVNLEENKESAQKIKNQAKLIVENNNITETDFLIYDKYIENLEKIRNDYINEKLINTKEIDLINGFFRLYINKLERSEYITSLNKNNIEKEPNIYYIILLYRINQMLVEKKFEDGDVDKGLNILINNQRFINIFIEKSDLNLLESLFIITIQKINLETINNVNEKYKLNFKQKTNLNNSLNKNINLIDNGIKRYYLGEISYYNLHSQDYIVYNSNINGNFINKITKNLFFRESEFLILLKKNYFEVLNNKGKNSFKVKYNLSNLIGRQIYKGLSNDYSKQYLKEKELIELIYKTKEKLEKGE